MPIRILLAALIALLLTPAAQARTYSSPIEGGDGGVRFTLDCPAGEFLVGIAGHYGSWIDHISVVCAPWDVSEQTLGASGIPNTRAGKSNGGRPFRAICPEGTALWGVTFQNTIVDDSAQEYGTRVGFVQNLKLDCRPMVPPYFAVVSPTVLSDNGHGPTPPFGGVLNPSGNVGCTGEDERGIGLIGRAGDFVDALGFDCMTIPRPPHIPRGALENHGGVPVGQQRLPDRSRAQQLPGHIPVPAPPSSAPSDLPVGPTAGVPTAQGTRYAYPYQRDKNGLWHLMDWCREYGANCGIVAARAFCAAASGGRQPNAVDFRQFVDSGRFQPSVTFGTKQICSAPTCDSFAYIVCHE